MKVTLDTNILVSGTFWTGSSFIILDMIDKKKLKNVSSKEIVEEYYKTINSDEIIDKIKDKKLMIMKIVHKVIKNSESVVPSVKLDNYQ
jgi:predicted nucleic acid-binding protein